VNRYTMWLNPTDETMKYLKSVEHKTELGGLIFGPFWILYKKGPVPLFLILLALTTVPIAIFGANVFSLGWAALVWLSHSRSHVGLQGMRLKSLGYERLAEISANTHEEAQAEYRKNFGPPEKTQEAEDANWFLVNTFGNNKTYIDRSSISVLRHFASADVIYVLNPYGTDKISNRPVKIMRMREEYDLLSEQFRVHEISFVYDDDSISEDMTASSDWLKAKDGNEKTLNSLRQIINNVAVA